MNGLTLTGALLITLALLSYGIGSISVQRFKIITSGIIVFLTLGVVLDLVAVTLMILGSKKSPFTFHGILGYTAVLTMLIDLFFIWRVFWKNGKGALIKENLVTYTKYAYGWWVITYITGSLLVLWK